MSDALDAIVVGAGHDGLSGAAFLAARGHAVVVLEAREVPGGVAAAEEVHPGFRAPGLWPGADRPAPGLVEALGLENHGLRLVAPPPLFVAGSGRSVRLAPNGSEPHSSEPQASGLADDLGPGLRDDPRVAARLADLRALLAHGGALVRALSRRPPPALQPRGLRALLELVPPGLAASRLPPSVLEELLRVVPMSAQDLAREWFDDELLTTGLAAGALHGLPLGPRAPGTAAPLLLRAAVGDGATAGGAEGLTRALLAAAREAGAEVRLRAPVEALLLERGTVRGVRLSGGEELRASAVLSTADPRTTLLDLVPPGALSTRLEEAALALRARGTTAVVLFALQGPPQLADRPGEAVEHLRIVRDLDDLERAADRLKYGELSLASKARGRPFAEVWIPTWRALDLAPPAHHVAVVHLQPVVSEPRGGWTARRRRSLGDLALRLLEEAAPGVADLVVARAELAPPDLAARLSRPGGHLHQLETALDQLFALRPTAECSRHATPIPGLFLGGSGCHPGPHARGGAGLAAARVLAALALGPGR